MNRRNLLFVIAIVCYALLLTAPYVHSEAENKREETAVNRANGYYFELDARQRSELLGKLRNVKVGDDYRTVIAKLGQPTHDQRLVTKDGRFKARVLSYYLKRWKKNLVNEQRDQLIRLELDQSEILVRIKSKLQ